MFERLFYDEETISLIGLAIRNQAAKAKALDEAWGLANIERWDMDLDAGTITFKNPNLIVVAPLQIIGTLVLDHGSWLWSWANPSCDFPLTRDARLVRDYGQSHGISRFEEPELSCTMEDAWSYTCLAAQLANAEGTYRGPFGECSYAFVTFGKPTVSRPAS